MHIKHKNLLFNKINIFAKNVWNNENTSKKLKNKNKDKYLNYLQ